MDERLERFFDLLDADDSETIGTSMRIPANLRAAAALARELGMPETTTEMSVRGVRAALDAFAQRMALDEHYRQYPETRPSLAEVSIARAELDGNPLASRPDVIRRAADEVSRMTPRPSPDDVLMFAAGLVAGAA